TGRLDPRTWTACVRLLDDEHRELREAVLAIQPRDLNKQPPATRYTRVALIQGITAHDLYHAGQIQLLKRLRRASGEIVSSDRNKWPRAPYQPSGTRYDASADTGQQVVPFDRRWETVTEIRPEHQQEQQRQVPKHIYAALVGVPELDADQDRCGQSDQ